MDTHKVIRIPARLPQLWRTEYARYTAAGRILNIEFVHVGTPRATMVLTLKGRA